MINNIAKEIRPLLKGAVVLVNCKFTSCDKEDYIVDVLGRIVEIKDDTLIIESRTIGQKPEDGIHTYHRQVLKFKDIVSILHYIAYPITFGYKEEPEVPY